MNHRWATSAAVASLKCTPSGRRCSSSPSPRDASQPSRSMIDTVPGLAAATSLSSSFQRSSRSGHAHGPGPGTRRSTGDVVTRATRAPPERLVDRLLQHRPGVVVGHRLAEVAPGAVVAEPEVEGLPWPRLQDGDVGMVLGDLLGPLLGPWVHTSAMEPTVPCTSFTRSGSMTPHPRRVLPGQRPPGGRRRRRS